MSGHSAKSLFEKNIQSAEECLHLFDGLDRLKVNLNIDWLLRASVVFMVSALDTYFHDKVKYRISWFNFDTMPKQLANFKIPISDLPKWDAAERKGNVLRNWVVDSLSSQPLQSKKAIAEALKLAGIENFWDSLEKDKVKKAGLNDKYNELIRRRNHISHEGDREQSRNSGKKLRSISRQEVQEWLDFVKELVVKIEKAFPN